MALIAAYLNAGHSGGDSVAVGIYSPSSPTSIPRPPFSPSLISLLWTLSTMFTNLAKSVFILPLRCRFASLTKSFLSVCLCVVTPRHVLSDRNLASHAQLRTAEAKYFQLKKKRLWLSESLCKLVRNSCLLKQLLTRSTHFFGSGKG